MMKKEILLAIAKHTRERGEQNWNMSVWKNACSSAKCCIGDAIDAGLVPGLALRRNGASSFFFPVLKERELDQDVKFMHRDFCAIAIVLEIESEAAYWLFDPDAYEDEPRWSEISRESVAARIEQFVASDGASPADLREGYEP